MIAAGILLLVVLSFAALVLTGIVAEPETVIDSIGKALFGR